MSSIKNHNSRLWVLDIKSSSTPAPCRQKIKDALKIIMSGDEKMLNTFIQEFRKEFMNLPPEEVAYPRSVNGISKFTDNALSRSRTQKKYEDRQNTLIGTLAKYGLFANGTPIHVKGWYII